MTTNRSTVGRSARGRPGLRSWARSPGLALVGLALVALTQAGCQSSGCDGCGFGSRLTNGVQALGARIFNHKGGCGGGADCGCGGELGSIPDAGVTVVPGGMALPAAPGTLVPGPAFDQPPPQLEPIPSNPATGTPSNVGNPSSLRSNPGGTNKSAYTTSLPPGTTARRRNPDVARAYSATDPAPTSNPSMADPNPIDFSNIPPVGQPIDLPTEVTQKAKKAPANPAGPTPVQSTPAPAPAPAAATDNATPTPAEKVSAAGGVAPSQPQSPAASTDFQEPGIRRYSSVAPTVAGGSAPSVEGLDWLKQKGCRTFIDLRRASEVDRFFVDAVNDRGMAYVSLPIVANRLDPNLLARFDDLISQVDNRPLYFCDADGSRAGLAWYLHLRNVDEEAQAAFAKAEEIGLNGSDVKLADDYLAAHKPRARAALAEGPAPAPVALTSPPAPAPVPVPPPTALPTPAASTPPPAPVVPPTQPAEPIPAMLPGEGKPQASTEKPANPRDPGSWRPVAALVLTGLGVPLAYWSKSALSAFRTQRRRASLPGPAPRPSDAPAGLDA